MESKYILIAQELERDLPKMLHSSSMKLPSEAELCARFSCSRQTVRAALSHLQEKQLIIKCRGSGSYISGAAARKRSAALILPSTTEYIYPSVVRSISRALAQSDIAVNAYDTGGSAVREREILTSLLSDPPAGIIMEAARPALPCISTAILNALGECGVPVVYINSAYTVPSSAVKITEDERGGAYNLAVHLSRGGCRKIICIMRQNSSRSIERYTGCMLACLDFGIEFCESDTLWLSDAEYENTLNADYSVLERFISGRRRDNCAILCCCDELAYHTVKMLSAIGFAVPDDISVAGFDNSYYATQSSPAITSVGTAHGSAAEEAAAAMLSLLTGRKARSVLLPMTVTLRQSTKKHQIT